MLRKNFSEQSLRKSAARVSLTKKLPCDFFMPLDLNRVNSVIRLQKAPSQKDENKQKNKKGIQTVDERKLSFEFTFYRSQSTQLKTEPTLSNKSKSSKNEILQKFNIKLPYIRSADSGVQGRKKIQKLRLSTRLSRKQFKQPMVLALR